MFCALEVGCYGLAKHLTTDCSKYFAKFGERDDPNVIQYISTVHTELLCPGCDKWFQGHHHAQTANHAQGDVSESFQNAVVEASLGQGAHVLPTSPLLRRDTTDVAVGSVEFDFDPSWNDLQGSNSWLAIDTAAQEAFNNFSESGQDTYSVGQFSFPGASRHDNLSSGEKTSASAVSFRDFDEMQP
jgi:hypothetical protein